jgi:hypothetical protein
MIKNSSLSNGSYTRRSVSIVSVVFSINIRSPNQFKAKEDCVARSLVKGESRDEDNLTDAQLQSNDEEEAIDDEDINEETHKENKESSEDGEETGNSDEPAVRRESQRNKVRRYIVLSL